MTKTCVISQPTFLPWLGWFDLADQADVMVILDDVQFSKQSWQQRNRIRTPAGLEFLTVPVKRNLGQLIIDCELADEPAGNFEVTVYRLALPKSSGQKTYTRRKR